MDAFNEKSAGPLVDEAAPPSEQEAIRFLMAGSVGWFKNPRSHRSLELEDPEKIGRMLMVASYLMRTVETRAALRKQGS